MSDFLISLWESVFTPGPTPTLLRATNATFASLQVLLLVLLVSTYSYHFLILSFLSGGLWWAINWRKSPEQGGSDTETEQDELSRSSAPATAVATGARAAASAADPKLERRKPPPAAPAQSVPKPTDDSSSSSSPSATSSSLLKPQAASLLGDSDLLKRRKSLGDSSGYVSTDSEWEKVSENGGN
ncbi:hypothetical protein DV738_g1745, partial [Chaetothyriales sp. CBS 135597]